MIEYLPLGLLCHQLFGFLAIEHFSICWIWVFAFGWAPSPASGEYSERLRNKISIWVRVGRPWLWLSLDPEWSTTGHSAVCHTHTQCMINTVYDTQYMMNTVHSLYMCIVVKWTLFTTGWVIAIYRVNSTHVHSTKTIRFVMHTAYEWYTLQYMTSNVHALILQY